MVTENRIKHQGGYKQRVRRLQTGKIMGKIGQRGKLRALTGICELHLSYFERFQFDGTLIPGTFEFETSSSPRLTASKQTTMFSSLSYNLILAARMVALPVLRKQSETEDKDATSANYMGRNHCNTQSYGDLI